MNRTAMAYVLLSLCAVLCGGGCTYMQQRGRDAAEMFDVGVTVSPQPAFSCYCGILSVFSLGYSHVDGTLYGVADAKAGAIPMRQNAEGVVLWGREQFGYGGNFDPSDPDSPQPWKVGIIGLAEGPGPRDGQVVNCPKLVHLGWVGLTLNCKFGEIADFLLGWTTLDLMGDDEDEPAG